MARSNTKQLSREDQPATTQQVLAFADIRMDCAAYRVFRGCRKIRLGPLEFRLLRHLLAHPRRVFTREQLLAAVWPSGAMVDLRAVDVNIARLRRSLTSAGETDLVRTVRSIGYSLDDLDSQLHLDRSETSPS